MLWASSFKLNFKQLKKNGNFYIIVFMMVIYYLYHAV